MQLAANDGQLLDGTYRLLRVVGQGAMGVVYEATHARLAGRYAIKVLTQRLADCPEGFSQFEREARNTSLLQHPNIVQVIDHNTAADGTEYLVMEYLAGESLARRLVREGRLSLDAVVDIIDQIAAGLAAAHARGIVHRDLKPENIVLVPVEGRSTELVKLLDFGISKRQGSLEASGLVCGTPLYMAPEQVEGRMLEVDSSTDQFALAVIAQELLTGRNPHAGDSVAAIFTRVSSAPPMSVGLGEDLDAVLARALAKSGRLRFRSITDFSTAFRAAARASARDRQRQAAAPPTDGGARRLRRSWRRNWRVALGVTAMAVALCLVAESRPNRLPSGGRASSVSLAAPRVEPAAVHALGAPQITTLTTSALTTSAQPTRQTDGERAFRPRTRPLARTRLASYTTRSQPRPALAADDDATMPPTEMAGVGPNP